MISKFNVLISSLVIALTLTMSHMSYGSEKLLGEDANSGLTFANNLPAEVERLIVTEAAVQLALKYKPPRNLARVSKAWSKVIEDLKQDVKNPVWKLLQGVADKKDNATYQAFLNGKLVYRPTTGSDDGKIEFKISDFLNPFKGTFNLSLCSDTEKYLTITTDPDVFFHINKEHPKCHILIAPHFLIKKYITSTTKPFANFIECGKDKAPCGIFWRRSANDNLSWFDYLSSSSLLEISSKNLYANYRWAEGRGDAQPSGCEFFMFVCEPK